MENPGQVMSEKREYRLLKVFQTVEFPALKINWVIIYPIEVSSRVCRVLTQF